MFISDLDVGTGHKFDPNTRYLGKPCKGCGSVVKYKKGKSCVRCTAARRRGDFYVQSPGDAEMAVAMYKEGFTVSQIQSKLRCPIVTVKIYLGWEQW